MLLPALYSFKCFIIWTDEDLLQMITVQKLKIFQNLCPFFTW